MTPGPGTDPLSGGVPRRAVIAGAATATAALALAGCSTAPKTAESASGAAGSGAAGATNFNVTDRVALTQLIHAYAIEWIASTSTGGSRSSPMTRCSRLACRA